MKVLLIRHAQSMNNIVQSRVHTKLASGGSNAQQAQNEWLSMREQDPGLSPAGQSQLQALQAHVKKLPRKTGCTRFKVVTSPMRRACETAAAVVSVLNCTGADVQADLCEVGGIYSTQKGTDGQYQKVRGNAPAASSIQQEFGFNVSGLPQSGPWDGGRGYEGVTESMSRAERVAQWIKSPSMSSQLGTDCCLVIVSHADFLALILACLCKSPKAGAGLNPDMDVSAHGVTEATLQGSMGMNVDNVYKRYRISLSCTTLLDVSPHGEVSTVWMNKKSHLGGCTIS
jgi:broad specificity phosphatase PhoE